MAGLCQRLWRRWGLTSAPLLIGGPRAGWQGQVVHEPLVEPPRALGQGQADALRLTQQSDIVWRALAMRVTTRLGLGGEVSAPRDMPRSRRLLARVRRCATHRPLLFCPVGWSTDLRAIRKTFRDSVRTGTGGRLRTWATS